MPRGWAACFRFSLCVCSWALDRYLSERRWRCIARRFRERSRKKTCGPSSRQGLLMRDVHESPRSDKSLITSWPIFVAPLFESLHRFFQGGCPRKEEQVGSFSAHSRRYCMTWQCCCGKRRVWLALFSSLHLLLRYMNKHTVACPWICPAHERISPARATPPSCFSLAA